MAAEPPHIHNLTEFHEVIKTHPKVALDFTAKWCGPCRMIGPKFVAMAAEFPNVHFAKVDVDEAQDVASEVGIAAMPTFQFYHNGQQNTGLAITGANEAKLRASVASLASA
eukprot:m.220950 g.220950  ORF g.220950 m.220950 type:complete len:111 (-) comp10483_c0_seq1:65-397(-)